MKDMRAPARPLLRLLVALGGVTLGAGAETRVTPIAKVLQLLKGMAEKGQADKAAEEKKFATFATWCRDQVRIKSSDIELATEAIEMFNAKILKADARIRTLTARVQELDEDVSRWTKDKKSASDVRDKESVDYRATSLDYSESLDALDQAIGVLKKQAFDRPQAELVQVLAKVRRSKLIPLQANEALTAFVQQEQPLALPDDVASFAPEAKGYEFQSGGVVEMLAKLKDEFSSKKTELDKEELNAQHNYELIMQQLTDNIENAQHEADQKATYKTQTAQMKAEAEGDLAQTTADREEDRKYLSETEALCTMKKSDYEARQKLRSEELATVQQVIDTLSSDAVAGSGEKYLPAASSSAALVQTGGRGREGRRMALAQLRSSQQSPAQDRIAAFLADRAQSSGSQLLSLVAQHVAADPFVKVKKLIKDLIWKLTEESTAEIEHKGWCDTEISTNKQTRESKAAEVASLSAEVEDISSDIAQLSQDVSDLSAALQELAEARASATEERQASKAKNEQTIQDAKAASEAVAGAISLLKDFYAKSADATASLVQQTPADDAPMPFEAAYKGMVPEGGNVIDFLEVIISDFTRLESETSSTEATEVDEYKKYMFESEKDQALKENEKGHKEDKITSKTAELHSTKAELGNSQEGLDKAMEYYEKLKPTCVDTGITYEDRVKRRETEMQSLKEAMQILEGTIIE